jgi:site-specific DNA-methyltransferase (adenine-specific)
MKYELNKLYNVDCMEAMKNIPDDYFELAIVDPPYFKGVTNKNYYGSDVSSTGVKRLSSESDNWDNNIPELDYFNELIRISKDQIIWGINYYNFTQPNGRIIWDKKNESSTFSDCEIASISKIESVKIFRYRWNGMLQENMKDKEIRIHPTQKPVDLYKWLLTNYAEKGDKILDTHVGSASSLIACYDLGFDYIGFELDEEYYNKAQERMKNHFSQLSMFRDI